MPYDTACTRQETPVLQLNRSSPTAGRLLQLYRKLPCSVEARRSGPLNTTVAARPARSGLMTADGVARIVLFPLFCALGAGKATDAVVMVVEDDGRWWCTRARTKLPERHRAAPPRHEAAEDRLHGVFYGPWRRRPCRRHTSQSALEAALCVHPSSGPRCGPNAHAHAHACRCTAHNLTDCRLRPLHRSARRLQCLDSRLRLHPAIV